MASASKVDKIKEILRKADTTVADFPPLTERTFETVHYACKGSPFRVMQWNVLADGLSGSSPTSNFIKCPSEALSWSTRKQRLIQGILTYEPDIICLEEVDHFYDFFKPSLDEVGYTGIFVPKEDSPCLKFPGNSGPDGTAIFFDKQRFKLRKQQSKQLKNSDGTLTNQTALFVHLFDNLNKKSLYCCGTHLKAKPAFQDLRSAQGKSVLAFLKDFMENEQAEVLVCGDFNAEPTEPVYQVMEDGVHGVPLRSAYKTISRSEPDYTTWKIRPNGEVKHTIDYVWHSEGLKVDGYLHVADTASMNVDRLPCMAYPSDHISLVFDFSFLE
ncbi:predicted protein [Nematostella vectensis]|uniref:Nocturnin n=1 Tax=Nematostella vectensis TaxID=45351 RepID=A7SNM0_NEMVE|nr:nocturnin [Nematostella vectensis]EDO34680.1 predicted protein [Nematostella vectensis]|eukprot:XP_001626780.1 predicted protein [Nematostella vectensis]